MRKVYIVPNIVTSMNLFCGFYSIVASVRQDFQTAAWAIIAATVFDLLDGRVARLARATSEFGVQFDSLSDLVSFGVAPGLLVYQWALAPFDRLGILASFLFVCCAALRLARFNVSVAKYPKAFFQGLPTPMAAGLVSTFFIFQNALLWPEESHHFVLVLTLGLASFMVSSIPFPSFKEVNWRARGSFSLLVLGVLIMILIAVRPEITLFGVGITYLTASLVWNLSLLIRGKEAFALPERVDRSS